LNPDRHSSRYEVKHDTFIVKRRPVSQDMFVLISDGESAMIGNSSNNTDIGRRPMSRQGMGQMNSGESIAGGISLGGA
jgi:hypothetical protein